MIFHQPNKLFYKVTIKKILKKKKKKKHQSTHWTKRNNPHKDKPQTKKIKSLSTLKLFLSRPIRDPIHPEDPTGNRSETGRPDHSRRRRRISAPEPENGGSDSGFSLQNPKKSDRTEISAFPGEVIYIRRDLNHFRRDLS